MRAAAGRAVTRLLPAWIDMRVLAGEAVEQSLEHCLVVDVSTQRADDGGRRNRTLAARVLHADLGKGLAERFQALLTIGQAR